MLDEVEDIGCGGIPDEIFLDGLPDWALCSVCHGVQVNSAIACQNGHSFCENCVVSLDDKNDSLCAMCREPLLSSEIPNISLNGAITSLRVKCVNGACDWTGLFGELNGHLLECGYTEIPCPFHAVGCNVRVHRFSLQEHLENDLSGHMSNLLSAVLTLSEKVDLLSSP
jgi:hypothetical protein